ncbi:MAG: AMP-binding protein, partial [Nitrososphaerales archaeon]
TTFCAPPTVWRLLILEDASAYKLSLRQVVSAGEPLNPEVIASWKSTTGLIIRDGFGQTETTLMVGNLPGSEVKLGSMGKPMGCYEISIVDDNGSELPINEEGNIAVRLHARPIGLFAGYIGDEERSRISFRGSYYYTGDRAYKDQEGRIWFVGRADDVIKSSDYRIGPFEVESVLLEHPAIKESAVVGSPDPLRGNEVKAFLVLKPGYEESKELAKEIFDYSREKLAHYKAPRLLEFTSELPKTISGKIRRVELRGNEAESKQRDERRMHEYSIRDFYQ